MKLKHLKGILKQCSNLMLTQTRKKMPIRHYAKKVLLIIHVKYATFQLLSQEYNKYRCNEQSV